jgi:hypothetical protein
MPEGSGTATETIDQSDTTSSRQNLHSGSTKRTRDVNDKTRSFQLIRGSEDGSSLRLWLKEWPRGSPLAPFPSASAIRRSPPLAPPNSWARQAYGLGKSYWPIELGGPAAKGEATDGDGDGNGSRGLHGTFYSRTCPRQPPEGRTRKTSTTGTQHP